MLSTLIIAVVAATETRPRQTAGASERLQAFADMNKLYPYGMAFIN
jgi:hypothetical protein